MIIETNTQNNKKIISSDSIVSVCYDYDGKKRRPSFSAAFLARSFSSRFLKSFAIRTGSGNSSWIDISNRNRLFDEYIRVLANWLIWFAIGHDVIGHLTRLVVFSLFKFREN